MQGNPFLKRNGQILMFVLFLLFLLGFIGTRLAVVWQTEAQLRTMEKDSLTALYLAQAGLERGEIYAKYNPFYTGWQPGSGASDWYTELPGGRYKFDIYLTVFGEKRVWAIGQAYNAASNKVLAEKQIEISLTSTQSWTEK